MATKIDLAAIAKRHGVSEATVETLLAGLNNTSGRQVQFSLPELGGIGQWMPGMVMVGRMGDHALKARVDALCTELAAFVGTESTPATETMKPMKPMKPMAPMSPIAPMTPMASPGGASTAGSRNGIRYAYFARTNRLAIERDGTTETYDTTGYPISGVSQAQANATPGTLNFTTSDGRTVDLATLKRVE